MHYGELDSDTGAHNIQSITEQSDLDNFLATAQLAGTDFTAGRQERVRRKKSSFHVTYGPFLQSVFNGTVFLFTLLIIFHFIVPKH